MKYCSHLKPFKKLYAKLPVIHFLVFESSGNVIKRIPCMFGEVTPCNIEHEIEMHEVRIIVLFLSACIITIFFKYSTVCDTKFEYDQ